MISENRPIRILFNGHDFKFLNSVISHYRENPSYEVLIDEHKGHVITNTRKSEELLRRADIIFCEWCLGNAEWYSKSKKEGQKLIIRFHRQEITTPYLERIIWKNVDAIIFICRHVMERFLERFPGVRDRALLINNMIDCLSFDLPKLQGAEFNLGIMGIAPRLKAPHLAFEILQSLKGIDSRYTLFIKGKQPFEYDWLRRKPEERQYFESFYLRIKNSEFANSVVFDPHGNDVPEWFSKIGFILSTSDLEGSHQAVAEGMASGAIPVIRNWDGADRLYPPKYIFRTVDEAVKLITKWRTGEHYLPESQAVKEFARENFDNSVILDKYDKLFDWLRNPGSKKEPFGFQSGSLCLETDTIDEINDGHITAMHVCYLNPLNQSGYETRVVEEAHLLKKMGVSLIIACFIRRDCPYSQQQLSEFQKRLETYTGAEINIYQTSHYFDIAVSPDVTKEIIDPLVSLAKLHKVGIIHGQALYSTMYALRANKRIGAKVVFDVHGASPEESEMSGDHSKRINVLTEWEKEALNTADMRIFVSNRMKHFFGEKYGLPELPHAIIPCCVHNERFGMTKETRDKKRELLGLKEKFVLMYLGTLSVWQWPEAMFSLFSQLHSRRPNSLFYLLLPESDHARARSSLEKHGLERGDFVLEEVPHTEIGSVIGVADAGVLLRKKHPVNYVSSPTKFGEYLAAGVPVISTEGIGDISDIIKGESIGIIVSATDKGLSSTDLERVIGFSHDVQRERGTWAERCTKVSRNILDWNTHGIILGGMYKRISGERSTIFSN